MKKVLFIFGTRPEAIKLAPLIITFKKDTTFETKVCVTAQHREMLDQVLAFFSIKTDYDLNLMKSDQSLLGLMSSALIKLEKIIDNVKPDLIFVQGDTTTVLVGSLVAFHKGVKVAHVEAGLRSKNKRSPFPEEMNRILTSHLSDFHFAPTPMAIENLKEEGITKNVFMVGNTVIDALKLGINEVERFDEKYINSLSSIDLNKKIILVTCHRRESFGKPFKNICDALLEISSIHSDVEIVYPVHLNPNIKDKAHKYLTNNNIKLIEPLEYPLLIWLMNKSHIILTDSGGIQEEAPSLGKPVLVLRDVTERIEGIRAGTARLVGTSKEKIIYETLNLLNNQMEYEKMANALNPYGDGTASGQILTIVKRMLS